MKVLTQVPKTVERVVEKVTEMTNQVSEQEDGFVTALGKTVVIHCMNYIYSGKLIGVNGTCLKLEEAGVVFETGSYGSKEFKDEVITRKSF